MTLEKVLSYDHSISEDGLINVRQITRIMEDGKEISKTYHRQIVTPVDDVSNMDDRTKLLANAVHSQTVKAAYIAKVATAEDN